MDSKIDCCVCIEDIHPMVEFQNCGHKNTCVKCYSSMEINVLSNINTQNKIMCPICRQECIRVCGKDIDTATKFITSTDKSQSLYQLTLTVLNRKDTGNIVQLLLSTYRQLFVQDKCFVLMTVDQTEDCLRVAKQRNLEELDSKILNVLVALCSSPWDVDVRLGSYGVCYHGNLGEKPTDGRMAFNYIHYNYLYLIGMRSFY